jgi:hypothetical protein
MPICPQCGSETDGGDDFCRSCGARSGREIPVTRQSHAPLPVKPPVKPHVSSSGHSAEITPRRGTRLSPVLVPGLVAAILIIAAAAFFITSGVPLSSGNKTGTNESPGSGTPPVNGQCSAGMSLCSGTCVNVKTDPDNCGACGFSVPYGDTCENGQFSSSIKKNTGGTSSSSSGSATTTTQGSCISGRTSCDGTCRDLRSEAANCGSCGNVCPSGQNCQDGRCVLPVPSAPVVTTTAIVTITPELSCSSGELACGSSCVNVFTDKKNCGVCGRACGSQDICLNARCGPACTDSGTTLCGDTCVDLDTDAKNCGACGSECKTFLPNAKGSECSDGKCVISQCKTDYGDCDKNLANGCEVNLMINTANCGSCGNACSQGQVCYNKKCSAPVTT